MATKSEKLQENRISDPIQPNIRQTILDLLHQSGLKYYKSKKSKGTLVVKGDLVQEFIQQEELLQLVDRGSLNVWSTQFKESTYTFVQSRIGMKPRYRDFGLFQYNQKVTLPGLRKLSKQIVRIDESHPEWYPWKYKLKLKRIEEYYFTQDWAELRQTFYNSSNQLARSCRSCDQRFVDEEQLLLNLHHKVPIKNGGTNTFPNLVSLCVGCHSLVHHDKELLVETLFIFFAETATIGNDKIRRSLVRFDDVATRFSQRSYLDLYELVVRKRPRREAKLFFFHKMQESFRYRRNKALYRFANYYFKVSEHSVDASVEDWGDSNLSSGESLYDLSVMVYVIYSLVDLIKFFEGKISSQGPNNESGQGEESKKPTNTVPKSLQRALLNTKEELKTVSNRFSDFVKGGSLSLSSLVDLYLIIDGKASFASSSVFGKNPYQRPNSGEKASYYEAALAERDFLFSEFVNAVCVCEGEAALEESAFCATIRECVGELGVNYLLKEVKEQAEKKILSRSVDSSEAVALDVN